MLLRSGIIVAFFTMLSRVVGLARELFVAYIFGTSSIADSVNVAFKLPNLFRRIFGEGALSVVFIPMFSEKLIASRDEAKNFAGKIFAILLITLILLTVLLQIFMPYVMLVIAPGFLGDEEKFNLTVTLCRITIPYVIFVSIIALFGGMLNSIRKFAAFAFVPILMSVCIIFVTYFMKEKYTAHFSLAYSLIIAGFLQVFFMYFCIVKNGLNIPLLFKPKDAEVKTLLSNMGPAALGSGTQQLNLFISQSIASFIPGAISVLSYADRLYQLPLSLIGVTFITILLPELSQIYQLRDYERANSLQNKAIAWSITFSIPAMFGLLVLSEPIIHIIYERGNFSALDTIAVSQVLAAFAFGLPAFVLSKVLTPIFYANLDTKTPLKITLYSLCANTILNIIFMIPFGAVGIAIGSSLASWFNLLLVNKYAKQYGDFSIERGVKIFAIKIMIISVFMAICILLIKPYILHLLYSEFLLIKVVTILSLISGSIIFLIILGYMFGLNKSKIIMGK